MSDVVNGINNCVCVQAWQEGKEKERRIMRKNFSSPVSIIGSNTCSQMHFSPFLSLYSYWVNQLENSASSLILVRLLGFNLDSLSFWNIKDMIRYFYRSGHRWKRNTAAYCLKAILIESNLKLCDISEQNKTSRSDFR